MNSFVKRVNGFQQECASSNGNTLVNIAISKLQDFPEKCENICIFFCTKQNNSNNRK